MRIPGLKRLFHLVVRPPSAESQVDLEVEFHLEAQTRDLVAAGWSPEEARREALRRFGDLRGFRRGLLRLDRRGRRRERRGEWLAGVATDLRVAARGLTLRPGFAAATILTITLAVGVNTALFSVLNAVLLRPLPYRDPGRLAMVWEHNVVRHRPRNIVNVGNYLRWKERSRAFQDLAVYTWGGITLTGGDAPEGLSGRRVSPNFFDLLGIRPALGRGFTPEEGEPGGPRLLVLSHPLWLRHFSGDSSVIGGTVETDAGRVSVIGVMPAGFRPLDGEEYWEPYRIGPQEREVKGRSSFVIGRLRAGLTFVQAQAEMARIGRELTEERPDFNTGWSVQVVPLQQDVVGSARKVLLLLAGAVGFVFLIACANIANLFLGRALARRSEVAVRTALGATGGRLLRQWLCESLLVALPAGLIGLSLAHLGVRALVQAGIDSIPRLAEVRVDWRVLAFALGATLLAALVFGLAPLLSGRADAPHAVLGGPGRTGTPGRVALRARGALVVAQVALSLVLLTGAGLLIRSIGQLRRVDPGFDPDRLLTLRVWLPGSRYPDGASQVRFFDALSQRLARVRGVQQIGAVSFLPITGLAPATSFNDVLRPAPPGEEPVAEVRVADTGYFRAMGIPLVAGRGFAVSDGPRAPIVVLVNRRLARLLWGEESAIGRRLKISWNDPYSAVDVIGVVGDVRQAALDAEVRPMIYYPESQMPFDGMTLVIRTAGRPESLVPVVRAEVRALDRLLPIGTLEPFASRLADSLAGRRYPMLLLGLLSGLALLLAVVGIYGVMAYLVTLRTREIGIRVALGATLGEVQREVMGRGLRLAALGVSLGLLGALAGSRALRSLLFEVTPSDPVTYAVVALGLLGLAGAASFLPARQAARVDPVIALRSE